MDALEALTTRVSASQLGEPAPTEQALKTILTAAMRAPDHGRLRPWRFVLVRGHGRQKLGELFAEALRRRHTDVVDVQLQRERAKPMRAAMILIVCVRIDVAHKIPPVEQLLSGGAAAQNALLAAHALGYGGAWKTGDAAYDPYIKAAFGLESKDAIVAFLYLGTSLKPLPQPACVEFANRVVDWPEVRA
jgi:nitroreductase